jgi:hypothetical protein
MTFDRGGGSSCDFDTTVSSSIVIFHQRDKCLQLLSIGTVLIRPQSVKIRKFPSLDSYVLPYQSLEISRSLKNNTIELETVVQRHVFTSTSTLGTFLSYFLQWE